MAKLFTQMKNKLYTNEDALENAQRLLVSSLACTELGSCHFISTTCKKPKKPKS
jgi:hypothetical protein